MLVVLLTTAGCGDDTSPAEERAEQLRAAAQEAGLEDDVGEILALAALGVERTFLVAYEVADPSTGGVQRVTVTQRPPDRRLDVERADGTADATITTGEASFQCTSDAEGWRCGSIGAPEGGGPFDPEVVDALAAALLEAAADYDFAVETRAMLGVDARCLVTTRKPGVTDPALGATATLCLSPEGAQLLAEVPTGTLRAVEYGTDLPADAFELPADVG